MAPQTCQRLERLVRGPQSMPLLATLGRPIIAHGEPSPPTRRPRTTSSVSRAGSGGSGVPTMHDVPAEFRAYDLPAPLRFHLDSWGLELRNIVENVRRRWLGSVGVPVFRSLTDRRLRLGTDCSGAEAPVWAMKAMHLPHDHIFSCDVDKQVQEFIREVCPPSAKLFADMLKRPLADVPEVDIYVCGFPCTPYSSLRHHRTNLFKEPAAKPYFQVLKLLGQHRPAMAILENVVGLGRVKDKVLKDLIGLKWYHVLWMPIDSTHFGEPVSRPRFYFLLLRRDACVSSDPEQMARFCGMCFDATHKSVRDHVKHRMLSNDHSEVGAWMRRSGKVGKPGSSRLGTKWIAKHAAYRQSVALRTACSGVPVLRSMALSSPRQKEVWSMLQRTKGHDIIADISQGIDRITCRTNGICPTITPRGVCCVGALGRPVLPCEKLLLHGFPLHKMRIPKKISDQTLAHLGGNTMHLHSVGLALLMGLSLLRDPLPRVALSVRPKHVAEPIFVPASRRAASSIMAEPPVSKRLRAM